MTTFVLKNLRRLFDKYAVACTEHDALVKSTTKIFFKFCDLLRKPKQFNLNTSKGSIKGCLVCQLWKFKCYCVMFIIRVTLYFLACAPEGAYATQWCRLGY